MVVDFLRGISFFWRGFLVLPKKGIRFWAAIPIFLAIAIWATAIYLFGDSLQGYIDSWTETLGDWAAWLGGLAWLLSLVLGVFVFSYTFLLMTELLSSPFNGALAEAVEARIHGRSVPDYPFWRLIRDLPLTLFQEIKKLLYYCLWAIPFGILSLLTGPLAPFIWAYFISKMLALEFIDYPMDNHRLRFVDMRAALKNRRMMSLGFGGMAFVGTTIPILNLFVIPAAVAGATLMWVEVLEGDYRDRRDQVNAG